MVPPRPSPLSRRFCYRLTAAVVAITTPCYHQANPAPPPFLPLLPRLMPLSCRFRFRLTAAAIRRSPNYRLCCQCRLDSRRHLSVSVIAFPLPLLPLCCRIHRQTKPALSPPYHLHHQFSAAVVALASPPLSLSLLSLARMFRCLLSRRIAVDCCSVQRSCPLGQPRPPEA